MTRRVRFEGGKIRNGVARSVAVLQRLRDTSPSFCVSTGSWDLEVKS